MNDFALSESNSDYLIDPFLNAENGLCIEPCLLQQTPARETIFSTTLSSLSANIEEQSSSSLALPFRTPIPDNFNFFDLSFQNDDGDAMVYLGSSMGATPSGQIYLSDSSQELSATPSEPATSEDRSTSGQCKPQASQKDNTTPGSGKLVCLSCPSNPTFQHYHEYT